MNLSSFSEAATDGCFLKIVVPIFEKHKRQYLTYKSNKMLKKYIE